MINEEIEVIESETYSHQYDWFDVALSQPGKGKKDIDSLLSFRLDQPLCEDLSPRKQNFFRAAKWSPDGSAIVTSAQDRKLRIFFLPVEATSHFYESDPPIDQEVKKSECSQEISPYLSIPRSMPTTSIAWYPFMNLYQDASNGCFLAGSFDHPLHLIDCLSGEIRASYPIIDHREKFIGPTSITFHPGGQWVYCGFDNMMQIIDLTRPGWEGWKQATSPSRKKKVGQKGLISCIDFQPGGTSVYAAGSFSGTIGLYDERQGSTNNFPSVMFPINPLLRGQGITHLQFGENPQLLYVGGRRSSAILEYDIRQPNYPTQAFPRSLKSDQRLSFDVKHNHLVTGDQNGLISIFDLSNPIYKEENSVRWATPAYQFHTQEGSGAVGCTQFHPTMPLLLTGTGSRLMDFCEDESFDLSRENPPPVTNLLSSESFLRVWNIPYTPKVFPAN